MSRVRTASLVSVWLVLVTATVPSHGAVEAETVLPDGPWGRVALVPIRIRLPESMVPDVPLPLQPWVLEMEREEAARLLADVGVDAVLAESLLSTYEPSAGGSLRPTVEMIRALDAEARARFYDVLRSIPGNASQRFPHRFPRRAARDPLPQARAEHVRVGAGSPLREAGSADSLLLSDLPSVMALVDDPASGCSSSKRSPSR